VFVACCGYDCYFFRVKVHAQDYSIDAVVITNYSEDSLENAWCSSGIEPWDVCVCVSNSQDVCQPGCAASSKTDSNKLKQHSKANNL
jgi:hypothetical protein